jgi:predicted metalloprotease with PDZ domain
MRNFFLFVCVGVFLNTAALAWSQETLGGLLGGQRQPTNNGVPTNNPTANGVNGPSNAPNSAGRPVNPGNNLGNRLENIVREQMQNALQPATPNGVNAPNNQMSVPNNQMTTQLGTVPSVGAGGLSLSTRNNSIWVSSVLPNSPAALAGLRANDQIISVNGNSFIRAEDLQAYLAQASNNSVSIMYLRNGQMGEVALNGSSQPRRSTAGSLAIQSKLDQIERLLNEIRSELANTR